ncbi:MAG: DUF4038 domain-containing protein [Aquamicrobium sp.]|nr:DUF4038 domain-containing protein [Aquamicrobium sp.]
MLATLRTVLMALLLLTTASTAYATAFPLRISDERNYLVDADNRPFLPHGDTAWSLIAELTKDEVDVYLADRRSRGFNTLVVSLIEHKFASNAPANAYRARPFAEGRPFEPNEAYFDHARWVLSRAREEGFVVLLTPAYLGFGGGEEGWYTQMQAAGTQKLEAYGRYLAEHFRGLDNIIWLHGGDYDPIDPSIVEAVINGLRAGGDTALAAAHAGPDSIPAQVWPKADWMDIETIYSYSDVHRQVLERYQMELGRPLLLLEGFYEGEHDSTEQSLREIAYGALLGGAAGQVFGNNPIWHFSGPGIYSVEETWREALASRGAQSMTHLKTLFDGIEWWTLAPASVDGPVRAEGGRLMTAVAGDRSWSVSYLVAPMAVEIDPVALGTGRLSIRWYDPSAGIMAPPLEVSAEQGKPVTVAPPAQQNRAGFADWVLLVSAGE